MGNIRDERFHYEMKHNRIKMFRPAEDPDDWFNILLVHQNRCAVRGALACSPFSRVAWILTMRKNLQCGAWTE